MALVLGTLAGCKDTWYVIDTSTPPTDAPTDAPTDGKETDDPPPPTDTPPTETDVPPEPTGDTGLSAHSGSGGHTGHTGQTVGSTADTGVVGGIPDPRSAMVPDACSKRAYYDPRAPTATTYYVGDFTVDLRDQVTGRESMHLFFNPAGSAALGGMTECVVVWTTTGAAQAPGACRSCTTGLALRMAVDRALTDCPAGFWAGSSNFTVDYDVDAAASGESTFTFSASGTYLGQWYWEDTRYTYLSDDLCTLF